MFSSYDEGYIVSLKLIIVMEKTKEGGEVR